MASRFFRSISSGRSADLVSTVLLVNLLVAPIRGGAAITLFGASVPTPSVGVSAALLAVWVGLRFWLRHRHRLSPESVAQAVRRYVPQICVAALFVIGLTMRLWGIGFGGPLVVHPDENVAAGVAVTMLKSGSLKPPVPYHYPTVYPYTLLPAFGLKYVRGKSAGLWDSLEDVETRSFEFYRLARAHSAVFGAVTILLTYILATKLWPGPRGQWAGVMAAALVTFSFNHIRESHHAVTDAALTFFTVVAFLAVVAAFRRGSARAYAIAGFACGIACATKYSALPVVAVLAVAHFLDWTRAWSHWQRLPVGLMAVPVGFFTGYPYAILNWPPFLEHLGWMGAHAGTREFDPVERFNYIVSYSAESGFGLPFTIVLGAGLLYYLHRRRAEELLAVALIVVSMILLAHTGHAFYPRYLLPILPAGALIVASLVVEAGGWLSSRQIKPRVVHACLAGAVAVLVWPQALESAQYLRYLSLPDTRAQAYEFLVRRFKPGATIASEDSYIRLPRGYRLIRWAPLHEHGVAEFAKQRVDALVFSSDREPHAGDTESLRARNELRLHFSLLEEFPARNGINAGPTVSIHLVPRE
jgi:4-amino-4-deoxy-L-arabinose transferase-like glycosyltransferase